VSHARWSEWIDDLVSGELPDDRLEELERHLASCEECRAERDVLRALRGATRRLAEATAPPVALETAVRSALDAADDEPPVASRRVGRPLPWLAAAAALALMVAGVWWLRAPPQDDLPAGAVESYRLHRDGQLPHAVVTADEAVLERFFEGQLDFPARVIDLRMMEYALVGGRVHELQGRPSALYAYRGPAGRVVLCQMLPGALEELPPPDRTHEERGFTFQVYERGDLTAVFWLEGEVLCVLVSDMPAGELLDLAREKAMA
jgi:anti-sigma factor RsiW